MQIDELNSGTAAADARLSPDCESWMDGLFVRVFRAMHTHEADNFDAERYRGVAPTAFFADHHARYLGFFVKHVEKFHRARLLLADEESRALFDQLILFRILGHLHVRLPFNTPGALSQRTITDGWKIGDTADSGLLGPLAVYAVPLDDMEIRVKCWSENVAAMFLNQQYYFERNGVSIAPDRGNFIVDAGGCFGDTALAFARSAGARGHVYTFDPMQKHCAIMRESFAMNPALAPRISIFECGLSNVDREGSSSEGASDAINPGATIFGGEMRLRTVDSLVAEGAIARIDFIKMDIEGSELDALAGAEAALHRWRPKLAISLYHRPEDFFAIPLWLDALQAGYRFFLDHYSIHVEETVLYAVAD
ncbi:MAG TPA: FkbM family methyltransferase [Casimicrobiaceae bacterium]|nr:FkbM family methyltransferase [Casimicrobiaceae bacterium]